MQENLIKFLREVLLGLSGELWLVQFAHEFIINQQYEELVMKPQALTSLPQARASGFNSEV